VVVLAVAAVTAAALVVAVAVAAVTAAALVVAVAVAAVTAVALAVAVAATKHLTGFTPIKNERALVALFYLLCQSFLQKTKSCR
jgi:hypothetical protein